LADKKALKSQLEKGGDIWLKMGRFSKAGIAQKAETSTDGKGMALWKKELKL